LSIQVPATVAEDVARALAEDVGDGDRTATLIPAGRRAAATVVLREAAVICGIPWAEQTFRALDPEVQLDWHATDGDRLAPDAVLLEASGDARALLSAERTALNFLQLLSGTATTARRYADAVAGTDCRILDTRKTIPGLRAAQKYAVACGGASNHRIGLFDAILIKENHIMAAGGIAAAVARAREASPDLPLEVEVEDLDELDQALAAGVDLCLLDNFDLDTLSAAVARNAGHDRRAALEASGNMGLDQVAAVAATGVDRISLGALTKHLAAVDLSMRFQLEP
jgi:nicotinate-nucleotide pyrophosphorylase (carboxylating)